MRKIKNYYFLLNVLAFLVTTTFSSCHQNTHTESDWEVVYRNDFSGNKISGDKQKLIEAVRKGIPIRIGFGGRRSNDSLKSIEHVADAQFLTIANGKEVFAQISPIFGQSPDLDSDSDTIKIKLKSENEWTLVIGTNGERNTLSRFFIHKGEIKSKQSNRGATWYAKLPNNFTKNKSKPLWD